VPRKKNEIQTIRVEVMPPENPNAPRLGPDDAKKLLKEAQDDVERAWRVYSGRAAMPGRGETPHIAPPEPEGKVAPLGAGRS